MQKVLVLHMVRELEIGGIQSLIINTYKNINKDRFQFDFLVSSKGILDEKIKELGGNIFYIPYITKVGPYKYRKHLKNFFLEHKEYSIIHLHFDQFSGLIAKVANECGIKVIISHAHIINNTTNLLGKVYKKMLQKDLLKYTNRYIACSTKAANWLFKQKANEAFILNNGINIEKFKFDLNKRNKIRQELKIGNDTIVYGNIGRLSKEKNQEFVIEVFKELYEKNNNSLLIIAGDGSLKQRLKAKIITLGLEDKIILLGNREDTEYLYSAMDVFIFPSLFEGLGISLIEAQMSGLQCYASNTIPKETNITDFIKYIDLNYSSKQWSNIIEKNRFKSAEERNNLTIKDNGYDIKNTAKMLSEFYEQCIGNEEK